MLAIGNFNKLKITRITAEGAYLATDEGEVLLPGRQLPAGVGPGDRIDVFVYLDSADRPAATTVAPKAAVGEFAFLAVTDTGKFGAFLDWGLEKDLLVPFAEQRERMRRGERHVVAVYLDNSGRIAASAKIGKFLDTADIALREGDEVELLIYELTELGAKVIINGRHGGVLFRSELHGREVGERLKGYVKKIRDDRKIDVTLKKEGSRELAEPKEQIVQALTARGGFLPLNDKSSPEMIAELLRMSKKTFKKAVGGLYKERLVDLTDEGVKLRR